MLDVCGAKMRAIPTYDLYGEKNRRFPGFWLHCETIPSRSSLHHWEIGLHRHEQFFQILYIEAGSGDAIFDDVAQAIVAPAVITVPPLSRHGFRFSKDIDGYVFTVLTSHLKTMPADHSRFGCVAGPSAPDGAAAGACRQRLHRRYAASSCRRSSRPANRAGGSLRGLPDVRTPAGGAPVDGRAG